MANSSNLKYEFKVFQLVSNAQQISLAFTQEIYCKESSKIESCVYEPASKTLCVFFDDKSLHFYKWKDRKRMLFDSLGPSTLTRLDFSHRVASGVACKLASLPNSFLLLHGLPPSTSKHLSNGQVEMEVGDDEREKESTNSEKAESVSNKIVKQSEGNAQKTSQKRRRQVESERVESERVVNGSSSHVEEAKPATSLFNLSCWRSNYTSLVSQVDLEVASKCGELKEMLPLSQSFVALSFASSTLIAKVNSSEGTLLEAIGSLPPSSSFLSPTSLHPNPSPFFSNLSSFPPTHFSPIDVSSSISSFIPNFPKVMKKKKKSRKVTQENSRSESKDQGENKDEEKEKESKEDQEQNIGKEGQTEKKEKEKRPRLIAHASDSSSFIVANVFDSPEKKEEEAMKAEDEEMGIGQFEAFKNDPLQFKSFCNKIDKKVDPNLLEKVIQHISLKKNFKLLKFVCTRFPHLHPSLFPPLIFSQLALSRNWSVLEKLLSGLTDLEEDKLCWLLQFFVSLSIKANNLKLKQERKQHQEKEGERLQVNGEEKKKATRKEKEDSLVDLQLFLSRLKNLKRWDVNESVQFSLHFKDPTYFFLNLLISKFSSTTQQVAHLINKTWDIDQFKAFLLFLSRWVSAHFLSNFKMSGPSSFLPSNNSLIHWLSALLDSNMRGIIYESDIASSILPLLNKLVEMQVEKQQQLFSLKETTFVLLLKNPTHSPKYEYSIEFIDQF